MKEIRSYTNVWKVERMFYGVNDWRLPRPVPQSGVIWTAAFFVLSLIMNGIPPFIFTDSMLTNHIGIPILFAWLMGKLKLDGKSALGVVISVGRFFLRPRVMVRGKAVRMHDIEYPEIILTFGRKREREEMMAGGESRVPS